MANCDNIMKPWMTGLLVLGLIMAGSWGIVKVMDTVYASSPYSDYTRNFNDQQNAPATGGCGTGSDCCSGEGGDQDPADLAYDYYFSKTGDADFEVVIEDFGCHQEADIVKNGTVVMRVQISGGQVTEL